MSSSELPASTWQPVKIAYDVIEPSTNHKEGSVPIFLLHGMTACRESWKEIPKLLADVTGRKVFALDARNHGDSEWSDLADVPAMAKDVSHFMDQHKIPKAILLGHSMGGLASMCLAFTEPEKVEKVVTEDITPIIEKDAAELIHTFLQLLKKSLEVLPPGADPETAGKSLMEFIMTNLPKGIVNLSKVTPDSSLLPMRKTENGYEWKTNLSAIEKAFFKNEKSTPMTGHYDGEILFIYGDKSPFKVSSQKDALLKMFPKAQFHGCEDTSHFVHGESPKEFMEVVLNFLKDS